MHKLLIANCNNTLRESISSPGGYINSPFDQQLIQGAIKSLKNLDESWDLVAVHNDGGVTTYNKDTGKMFKSVEDSIIEQRYTLKLIRAIRPIKAIFVCPDAKGDGSTALKITSTRNTRLTGGGYRLPNARMVQQAIATYTNTKNEEILYVGDDDTDLEAAQSLKIPFQWAYQWWS